MKQLKDLKGAYGREEISQLVEFTNKAPILLPETQEYYLEKSGSLVQIYGMSAGIKHYNLGQLEEGMHLEGIDVTTQGTEIALKIGDVERIILHSQPHHKKSSSSRRNVSSTVAGESRDGESRGGESRIPVRVSSESRSSGESRQRSSGTGYSRGESRSGESR